MLQAGKPLRNFEELDLPDAVLVVYGGTDVEIGKTLTGNK